MVPVDEVQSQPRNNVMETLELSLLCSNQKTLTINSSDGKLEKNRQNFHYVGQANVQKGEIQNLRAPSFWLGQRARRNRLTILD